MLRLCDVKCTYQLTVLTLREITNMYHTGFRLTGVGQLERGLLT